MASVLVAAILRTEEAPDSGTTPQRKLTKISLRVICFFNKFTLAPPAITSCKQTQPPTLNEAVCARINTSYSLLKQNYLSLEESG